jgi:hypothetical protein
MLTGWITFEVDVEGDTAKLVSALGCTLGDIVVVHGVISHVAESERINTMIVAFTDSR